MIYLLPTCYWRLYRINLLPARTAPTFVCLKKRDQMFLHMTATKCVQD